MTREEKLIVMAYTGISTVKFDIFQEWVSELLGEPIFTHTFVNEGFREALKQKVKPMFLKILEEE